MHVPRMSGAAVATALVTVGLAVGGAQAGTENVVPTVRHEMRTIKRAAAAKREALRAEGTVLRASKLLVRADRLLKVR